MATLCNDLVIFLLFLSLHHACNARKLGVVMNKELSESGLLPANKVLDPSTSHWSNEVDLTRKLIHKGTMKVQDDQYQRSRIENNKSSSIEGALVKTHMGSSSSSTGSQRETLVSVPWKLPHKKKGKRQPWIDLDYSPPKTHPPVHN
ncbi:hypothetical protein LIER_43201 [Lithospermum erythrorhizon]|uniref:Uncharacterized protein n=1 Tax=Lithospermum erythrorhizon TaxID=34254 RepID=A0AAV3PMQ0_LITER